MLGIRLPLPRSFPGCRLNHRPSSHHFWPQLRDHEDPPFFPTMRLSRFGDRGRTCCRATSETLGCGSAPIGGPVLMITHVIQAIAGPPSWGWRSLCPGLQDMSDSAGPRILPWTQCREKESGGGEAERRGREFAASAGSDATPSFVVFHGPQRAVSWPVSFTCYWSKTERLMSSRPNLHSSL